MKKVLIIAEAGRHAELKKASLELLAAAKGQEVHAVIFGSKSSKAAAELAGKGAREVFWFSESGYDNYHSEAYANAAAEVVREIKPQVVLGISSSLGKDLLPKLAARFQTTIVADCIEINLTEMKIRRPFFSGKAIGTVQLESAEIVCLSLRPNSLSTEGVSGEKGKVNERKLSFEFSSSALKFVGRSEAKSDRPDLTEADVIVSGGRSLKTKENFKIIFDCADAFGGAAGASRAAVDEGLAEHDMQVGQTGKTVNPKLYIACGISGAIQHLAGMRTSKVIVAINKDANAPIFSKADYGIVGDLFEVVPFLTEEARKLLGKAA